MELTQASVRLRPRGIGNNWLPCGWCAPNPTDPDLKHDIASFVNNEAAGREALEVLKEAGVRAVLDLRRADEGRFQVKVGACDEHRMNLDFLGSLLSHMELTVALARRTVQA